MSAVQSSPFKGGLEVVVVEALGSTGLGPGPWAKSLDNVLGRSPWVKPVSIVAISE